MSTDTAAPTPDDVAWNEIADVPESDDGTTLVDVRAENARLRRRLDERTRGLRDTEKALMAARTELSHASATAERAKLEADVATKALDERTEQLRQAERERDSLARRVNVRYGELVQARAETQQYRDERDAVTEAYTRLRKGAVNALEMLNDPEADANRALGRAGHTLRTALAATAPPAAPTATVLDPNSTYVIADDKDRLPYVITGWIRPRGEDEDGFLTLEFEQRALTPQETAPNATVADETAPVRAAAHRQAQDAYQAAALAYCRTKFDYQPNAYVDGEAGAQRHVERDAADTAQERWLQATVDAALEAAGTCRHNDAVKAERERDSLARRLAVRYQELTEARQETERLRAEVELANEAGKYGTAIAKHIQEQYDDLRSEIEDIADDWTTEANSLRDVRDAARGPQTRRRLETVADAWDTAADRLRALISPTSPQHTPGADDRSGT